MNISDRIIDHLPLYARLIDRHELLAHVADSLQPQLDRFLLELDQREIYFDPAIAPESWLDWLGQFAGLSMVGDRWLGTGLNPRWDGPWKREVIERANAYFARKGTEWGVREAIALWLRFAGAHDPQKLVITLPFGQTPIADPPQWFSYATPYDMPVYQDLGDRRMFGAGDYPRSFQPDWVLLEGWALQEYGAAAYDMPATLWSDRTLSQAETPIVTGTGSALGPQRPWMHLHLTPTEWLDALPNAIALNPEIWSSFATPAVFGWLDYDLAATPLRLESAGDTGGVRLQEKLFYQGFQFYDIWPYEAGRVITTTITTTTEEVLEVWPGHSFGDAWNSADFPTPWESMYYVPYTVQTIVTETETTETVATIPGAEGEVITGYEEQIIGQEDPTDASQLLDVVPSLLLNLDEVEPLDLSGVAPLDLAGLGAIALDISLVVADQGYQWVPPLFVQAYGTVWGAGFQYYYPGSPGSPGSVQLVPIIEIEPFCNVPAFYSRRIIEREFEEVPIEGSDDLLELYPQLEQALNGNQWKLLVEATENCYLLRPVTFCAIAPDGTRTQRVENLDTKLFFEFALMPKDRERVRSVSLILGDRLIWHQEFPMIRAEPEYTSGWRLTVPFAAG